MNKAKEINRYRIKGGEMWKLRANINHDCNKECVCKLLPMIGYFVKCEICNISATHRIKSKAYAEFKKRVNERSIDK